MENSSYSESLEAKTKERYHEKLSCVDLSIQDDPYLPTYDARFVDDMATCMATIEFGHIFGFIHKPTRGVYLRTATFMEAVGCLYLLPGQNSVLI